jgi:Cyclic nucleotide-binding domain
MGLLRRLSGWRDARREPPGDPARHDPARHDPASEDSLLRLRLSFGHRDVDFAIGRQEHAPAPTPRKQSSAPAFWDALDPTEREALRSVASWRTFAAGARIMEEGERADHVMVILGGRAKVCVDHSGTERVLAVRALGQLIGERAALDVSVRSATVIALEMVWALVVQTRDFAAFLSAHPRVRDIVENQRNDRGTAEPDEGRHDYDYDPPGSATWIADGTADEVGVPNRWLRRTRRLHGENCTVSLTDVVEFGTRTRTDRDRELIREALFRIMQAATRDIPDAQFEDRGDGFLTVVPPDVTTARVIDQLLRELPAGLALHNGTQREAARFKVRLAVNVGPVVNDMGVSGEAIIVAARLLEARQFKQAIARSTATLGVIVSPFVYETVIRHRADPRDATGYSEVRVEVKESDTTAWMKLIAAPVSSPSLHPPAAPESYLGL